MMKLTKTEITKALLLCSTFLSICLPGKAQIVNDSIQTKELGEVIIGGDKLLDLEWLPPLHGTRIWAGKKNEAINIQALDANVAEKNARQIFAKVPGVFVYDMDGTGNQINIATRGLDPHRGWEFNIRRDDAITNSDMYGYPASHFSMPMEAVERIELVRGTGSLQYGAQFGGMLNYKTKSADTTHRFGYESINSVGSNGLLSTFHAVGGRVGKLDYYAYASKRVSQGYRKNSQSTADAEAAIITYLPTPKLRLNVQLSHSQYVHQLAGALNDSQFLHDPTQSTRARNYYSPDIYVPSAALHWKAGNNTTIKWLSSAVLGTRESVMFDRPADVPDMIDPQTLKYAPRQVDIDRYNSYTSELRILHKYRLFNQRSAFVAGVQLMNNDLHRRQQGRGTAGSDFDLTLTHPEWGRNLHFETVNLAAFVENKFTLSERLSVSTGIRVESGKSDLYGKISYYPEEELPTNIIHEFALAAVNMEYSLSQQQNIYGGWSQAYRPVILKDIVPSSTFEKVDDNLKDAHGHNMEVGYRGIAGNFRWDISAFQVAYNNRLGMLVETDDDGNTVYMRTNFGNSTTLGLEVFGEYFLLIDRWILSVFTSTAWQDARYRDASLRAGDQNVKIDGNRVESVPEIITRNGANVRFPIGSVTVLYSYTAESYADALNTKVPSANGALGLVPDYGLLDINTTWEIAPSLIFRFNINNVTDKQYFTKRPQFYPGPGIWPSDGRSFVATFGLSL